MNTTEFDPELLAKQASARADGRCGSLQTYTGLPCLRRRKPGHQTCDKHGARVATHIAKAERLLAVARMPAIEFILEELDHAQENPCEHCGYPRLDLEERKHLASVSFKLMDRTGLPPGVKMDVSMKTQEATGPDFMLWLPDELAEYDRLFEQMQQLDTRVAARLAVGAARAALGPAILDGVTVPDAGQPGAAVGDQGVVTTPALACGQDAVDLRLPSERLFAGASSPEAKGEGGK